MANRILIFVSMLGLLFGMQASAQIIPIGFWKVPTAVVDPYDPVEIDKLTAGDAAADDEMGRSVAVSGNTAIVGAHLNDDNGTDSGSAYIMEYDPSSNSWVQQQKLTASDAAAGDEFGRFVAIDGNTAAVGSYLNDDTATDSGSVYIFEYDPSSNTWIETQKINASDAAANDEFGRLLDISGNTIIVGAYKNDDAASRSGSIYIFQYDHSSDTWSEVEKVTASDAAGDDEFGRSVSISNYSAIVGAHGNDDGASNTGSAYIIEYDPSSHDWREEHKLTASDAAAEDAFGYAVAISGNIAVVGAYKNDDGGSRSGSAYVFEFDPSTNSWDETQILTASDEAADDEFGKYVDISGGTIIVSGHQNDDNGSNSGSAYVFSFDPSSNSWVERKKLTAGDAAADDEFGYGVSVSGNTAIVGAYQNDDGGSASGSAYIINIPSVAEGTQTKLTSSDTSEDADFGQAAAISGNIAIVGDPGNAFGGSARGSAHILEYDPSVKTWVHVSELNASDAANDDEFGFSVAISGRTAIVGASENDDVGDASGSAYIFQYDPSTNTWGEIDKLTASDEADGDEYGRSVGIAGNTAIVGAYRNDDAGSNSGAAYIIQYDPTSDTWAEEQKLRASDEAANDRFGYRVAISGQTAVIGAPWNDDAGSESGSAYIFEYDPSAETWTEKQKITASDAAADDNFGHQVAISGNTVLIGAYLNSDAGADSGSAYIFEYDPSSDSWDEKQKLTAGDAAAGDEFGRYLAIDGNIAVVSSWLDADGGSNSGSSYIFEFDPSADSWNQKQKITADDAAAGDTFGQGIGISGNNIVSGAPGNSDGAAYFFNVKDYP